MSDRLSYVLEVVMERKQLGKSGVYFEIEEIENFFNVVKDFIGSEKLYDRLLYIVEDGYELSPFETVGLCRDVEEDIRKTYVTY